VAKTLMDSGISLQKMRKAVSYLKKNMQKGLLKMQKIGAQKLEKAKKRSAIQMMEGVFGKKLIRRGSK
jgi:hypothetical protein